MSRPAILLADDHELVAEGLRKLLEPDFNLLGILTDGALAVREALRLRPDVILLDISLGGTNGIEVARAIRARWPEAKIVFVTMQSSPVYVAEALRAGGMGYVLKQAAAGDLMAAIRSALAGRVFISPRLRSSNLGARGSERDAAGLTRRQRQVLELVAHGKTSKEIATLLHISPKTVEFHKLSMMRHLNLHNNAELIRYAIEQGIVDWRSQ